MSNPVIVNTLKSIAEWNGGLLMPAHVVDHARAPESPLHSWFEWDDSKAAEDHRLWQARQLIRVTVQMIPTKNGNKEANVFVSLVADRTDGGYRQTVHVLSDKALRGQLLHDALEELNRMESKYQELKELAAVFSAARRVRRAA